MKIMKRDIGNVIATLVVAVGLWFVAGTNVKAASFYADPSENSTRGFVTRMYEVVLNREPDEAGYNDWVGKINSGERSAGDIVYGFFFSDEYRKQNKNNTEIATDFYHTMLNREPDADGLAYWKAHLDIGMTMQSINFGFVESTEFKQICAYYGINNGTVQLSDPRDLNYERSYFVYRLYKNCLNREPDADGYRSWCQYLADGNSGANCAYGFLFSKEFWNRHYTNEEYVDVLYTTILGRAADAEGKAGWVNQLNYTNTREHVLNGFLFSPEFSNQCATAGIQVGSPVAEPDGDTAWQYNIRILELCNQNRRENGVTTMLTTREDLWRDVAMVRAAELPTLFSHGRPDGRECFSALEDVAFPPYSQVGENIAAGHDDPDDVVNGWMHSSGHRRNILDPDFEELATGFVYVSPDPNRYNRYYCQNFYTSR